MKRSEKEEIANSIRTIICTALRGEFAENGLIIAKECKDKLMKLLKMQISSDPNIRINTFIKSSTQDNNYCNSFNQPLDDYFQDNQDIIVSNYDLLSPKMEGNNGALKMNENLGKLRENVNSKILKKESKNESSKRKRREIEGKPTNEIGSLCLICNKTFPTKIGNKKFKNHLLKCCLSHHPPTKKGVKFYSVSIKSTSNKNLYGLEILLPYDTGTFKDLDQLLRNKWLECCKHKSQLWIPVHGETVAKANSFNSYCIPSENFKWEDIASNQIGDSENISCCYIYDDENPTICTIIFNGITTLSKDFQKKRTQYNDSKCIILAHNIPFEFPCSSCSNKNSSHIEFSTLSYKCSNCLDPHLENYLVCNSPRMGTCLYQLENDIK